VEALRRCLSALGWSFKAQQKSLLECEHERPSVLLERAEYLAFLHEYGHRIIKRSHGVDAMLRARKAPGELPPYTKEEQDLMGVDLDRDMPAEGWSVEGERQLGPILLISQDEASFSANPILFKEWSPDADALHGARSRPKGKGASLMVSAFLSILGIVDVYGFRTGKAYGHWNSGRFIPQVQRVFKHVEKVYDIPAVLFLDHSSSHKAYSNEALNAGKLNKSNGGSKGGAKISLRDTRWPLNPDGSEIELAEGVRPTRANMVGLTRDQALTDSGGSCLGLLAIVELREGSKRDARGLPFSKYSRDELEEIVSEYADFRRELTIAQRVAGDFGCIQKMLPRFGAELQPPELLWAYLRQQINSSLNGNAATMIKAVMTSLAAVPLAFFDAWSRRTERYIRAYQLGLRGEHAFRLVRLMTGRGARAPSAASHLRPGVINPEDDDLAPVQEADDEEGHEAAPLPARGAGNKHYCGACELREAGMVRCQGCAEWHHAACMRLVDAEVVAASQGGAEGASPAAAGGGGGLLCPTCEARAEEQGAAAEEEEEAGPDYVQGVRVKGEGVGRAWVPEAISDPVAWRAWAYLEAEMGARNAPARFARAKGRFKAVLLDACKEMARPERTGGAISLVYRTMHAAPTPLTYLAPLAPAGQ